MIRRKNPLTRKETAKVGRSLRLSMGRMRLYRPGSAARAHHLGSSGAYLDVLDRFSDKKAIKQARKITALAYQLIVSDMAKKIRKNPCHNPHKHEFKRGLSKSVETCYCGRFRFRKDWLKKHPPIVEIPIKKNCNPQLTQIGRTVTSISTTQGSISLRGLAPIYGMSDGSIFIRGFFDKLPGGNVTRVEYLDEAKAKRVGAKNPDLPWRHDFTKERRPLRKTRGGIIIPAGKRPLWGKH